MKLTILSIALLPAVISAMNITSICKMASNTGLCYGKHRRWYYDPDVSRCKLFIYSGCGGNDNNFLKRDMCEKACSGKKPISEEIERICSLTSFIGSCRQELRRWYYDVDNEMCKLFVYSGCDGNENNFETRQECMAQCSGYSRPEQVQVYADMN
ncbi:boophilin-H2 [Trichonephila inaurata madagascariensis]|uniref:Boophilin-H2 n=1 Tax=Trichonephila inaurata madagascariensis TaxID=2747483 RepID=A0A8X6Y9E6_9ARAC|nr:boophilin-H2 [Trichonephila inaurata madagascariensis]